MKPGPPRKPTALRIIEGNRSKRPLPENEPKPAPVIDIPKPPSWLNRYAKKEWKRLAPELVRTGVLTKADVASFTMLCQAYGKWEYYERDTEKHGDTCFYTNKYGAENEVERPQAKLAQKAHERYKALCTEFGLTPASRPRIEVTAADSEADPLEALMSK